MEAFEDLKTQWKDQEEVLVPKEGAKQLIEKIAGIRKKQGFTNLVLSITVVVLIAFFFYISAYNFQTSMIGLLIMIGVLIMRIALEFFSIKKLRNMSLLANAAQYKQEIRKYYASRRKVHFISTPIIVIAYCIGFYILLPGFKASLSTGFYWYIIASAIVTLLVLSLFIGKQIQQELKILRNLKE